MGWSRGPKPPDNADGSIHEAAELPDEIDIEQVDRVDPQPPARAPLMVVVVIVGLLLVVALVLMTLMR